MEALIKLILDHGAPAFLLIAILASAGFLATRLYEAWADIRLRRREARALLNQILADAKARTRSSSSLCELLAEGGPIFKLIDDDPHYRMRGAFSEDPTDHVKWKERLSEQPLQLVELVSRSIDLKLAVFQGFKFLCSEEFGRLPDERKLLAVRQWRKFNQDIIRVSNQLKRAVRLYQRRKRHAFSAVAGYWSYPVLRFAMVITTWPVTEKFRRAMHRRKIRVARLKRQ
jgi:hypothetical protein